MTFHRAIDLCRDSNEALETLAGLGVERVLTFERRATALEGAQCIAGLIRQSAGRVAIMAGGGITAEKLPALLAATGVGEVHFSAREIVSSPMYYCSLDSVMGIAYTPNEYIRRARTVERVRQVVEAGMHC